MAMSFPVSLKIGNAISWKVAGSNPNEAIGFFNFSCLCSRNMALGLNQPLTKMITRNFPREKSAAGAKVDYLTAICEPIV
jgi:hypothetical protein